MGQKVLKQDCGHSWRHFHRIPWSAHTNGSLTLGLQCNKGTDLSHTYLVINTVVHWQTTFFGGTLASAIRGFIIYEICIVRLSEWFERTAKCLNFNSVKPSVLKRKESRTRMCPNNKESQLSSQGFQGQEMHRDRGGRIHSILHVLSCLGSGSLQSHQGVAADEDVITT